MRSLTIATALRLLPVRFVLGLLSAATTAQPVEAQGLRRPPPTARELAELGLSERSLQVGPDRRWLLVQPPPDASRPAPVVVLLHGGTQSMRRLFSPNAGASRGWPSIARRENVLLLVPNGTDPDSGDSSADNQVWHDFRHGVRRQSRADDVGFILAMLDWAHATYRTDRSRVYVTGASNGGMMTFRLLIEAPERFAAGATFIASLPDSNDRLSLPKLPTPLLIAHGTADPLIKWEGGSVPWGRGRVRSGPATVAWWIAANRAIVEPAEVTRNPDRDPSNGCAIEVRRHRAQPGGAVVVAYRMIGGGHAMPSSLYPIPDNFLTRKMIGPVCRDIEGAELAWTFLSNHRR